MSRPVKEIMMREYRELLGDNSDAVAISIRGIDAAGTTDIRSRLRDKEIRVTVIRNNLFTQTFADTGLAPLGEILTGASARAYGGETVVDVAREIVNNIAKDYPDVELKGAVLDGMLFAGAEGVERLSKFPTRDEAIAQAVTLIVSPGRNLVGAIKGPGGRLLGVVKAIEEKLEAGETIAKVN